MLRPVCSFLILLLFCNKGFAQQPEHRPQFINQSSLTYTFNPALQPSFDGSSLQAVYRNRTGDFAAIRSFGALLIGQLNENQDLYLDIVSDQLGPFFQKNRVYAGYAIAVDLNDQFKTGFGASGGFINYHMEGSSGGAGGSDFTTDANAGVFLSHRSGFMMGVSVEQFLNHVVRPISYQFIIQRYIEYQVGYEKELSESVRAKFLGRWQNSDYYHVYSQMCWNDQLIVGCAYSGEGLGSLLAGYQLPYENYQIGLNAAYSIPLKANPLNKQMVEMYLLISKRNKK